MQLSVRAAELATLLDRVPGIQCLSLDCFDTLLWRNVNKPTDVFTEFDFPGGGLETRVWAETRARACTPFSKDQDEVTIDEIYAALMPAADPAARTAAIEAELSAEARHCYGFAPVRDLIASAKARGLKVVIVSDTYLNEARLRALIAAAAGDDVAAMIDRIFCSSDYGMSKAGGLFVQVLPELGVAPARILHVGDNQAADQEAPARLGICTAHLVQFDSDAEQRLRLEAAAGAIVNPAIRQSVPAYQPHRPQIALRDRDDAAYVLGHDVLGPIMHGFADWVHAEATAMRARLNKPVKLLFLLRDGYLPARAYAARYPDAGDDMAQIELSRFTARAASFVDEAAIRDYLLPELAAGDLSTLARQLGFHREECLKLTKGASPKSFAREVLKPVNVQKIINRSRRFMTRLAAHLAGQGVQPGDAVMLVDLGYNGSVQNAVEPALRQHLQLDVAGRYLLLREMTLTGHDKRGWIDTQHYDLRALHSLSESIAIVEQLCTVAQGSVINYRDDGTPVRGTVGVKAQQSDCRDQVQAACLDFVRQAGRGFVRPARSDTAEARRHMAVASLARILFLPLAGEVALLEQFHHDANLGTRDLLRLVDLETSARALRQRGLFYTKNAMRMYLPGELQRHGLPINLALLTARRFDLDLRKRDFDVGAIALPIILADATDHAMIDIDAHPTSDGYYQALIPVGAAQLTVCLPLGRLYDIVQIDQASFHVARDFMRDRDHKTAMAAAPLFDGMEETAPGLFRTGGDSGLMVVPPPAIAPAGEPLLLSVVFRPILARADAARAAAGQKAA
jgi:FMN phosphatase YigB (HAD superfamily)